MKAFLVFLSYFYRFGCQIKNWLYNLNIFSPKKAPIPVISVGNITFGGTGKTPLVQNLISFLLKNGFKPALISRGYKGKWEKSGGILSDGKNIFGSWKDSGDEPYLVAQNFPQAGIFIGKNRLLSCQKANELGFELAVLDDGYQHRRLHRDLDIVLFDTIEKTALREPISSLKRARILLIKKGGDFRRQTKIRKRLSQTAILEYSVQNMGFYKSGEKEREPDENLRNKRILALSGIARPERFLSFIKEKGINPANLLKFPDHHSYPNSSLKKITKKYQRHKAEAVITTEKDAVKITKHKSLRKIPIYYLKIDLKLGEEFYSKIRSFLQNKI